MVEGKVAFASPTCCPGIGATPKPDQAVFSELLPYHMGLLCSIFPTQQDMNPRFQIIHLMSPKRTM